MNRDERTILRLFWIGLGAIVAWQVWTHSLPYMTANGVSADQAGLYSLLLASIFLAAWVGTLKVTVGLSK